MERSCTCGGANANCRWCSGSGYTLGPLPTEKNSHMSAAINTTMPEVRSPYFWKPHENENIVVEEIVDGDINRIISPPSPQPLPTFPGWLKYLLIFLFLLILRAFFPK